MAVVAALALVTGLLVVGWTFTPGFRHGAAGLASALIARQTGEVCEIMTLRPMFFPPGIEARGLRIRREDGRPIVSIDRTRVTVGLTRAGFGIHTVSLYRPVVTVGIAEGGGLDAFRDARGGDGEGLRRIPWQRLDLYDGHLALTTPGGAVRLTRLALRDHQLTGSLVIEAGAWKTAGSVSAPWVQSGGDRVVVTGLQVTLPELDVRADAAFDPARGEPLEVRATARADLDGLTPALWKRGAPEQPGFAGLPALHGIVDADVAVVGTLAAPRAEITLAATGVGFDLAGIAVPRVSYRIGDVALAALADPSGLAVQRLHVAFGDGDVWFAGTIDRAGAIEGHLLGEDVSLATILHDVGAAPTPWVDLHADVDVHVRGTTSPFRIEGPFGLAVRDLRVGGGPIRDPRSSLMLHVPQGTAEGHLVADRSHLVFRDAQVLAGGTRGVVNMDLSLVPGGPLELGLEMARVDLSALRPLGGADLRGSGTLSGRIHGPTRDLAFEGTAEVNGFGVVGVPWADHLETTLRSDDLVSLDFVDARARKGKTDYHGQFGIRFRDPMSLSTAIEIPDGRIEDVVGLFVTLEGLTGHLAGTVTLDGPVFDLDGEARVRTDGLDVYGLAFARGAGVGHMDRGIFTLDRLRLERPEGGGGLEARGAVGRAYAVDLEVLADGLDLGTLDWLTAAHQPLRGEVSLAGRVGGTLSDPAPAGRLTLTHTRYAERAVDDSTAWFETQGGVTTFTGLLVGDTVAVDGTIGLWDTQPYHVDARLTAFPAHALYPIAADGSPVSATASGWVRVDGHLGDAPSPVDLEAQLTDVAVGWGRHLLRNLDTWGIALDGPRFALTDVGLTSVADDGTAPSTAFSLTASGDDRALEVNGSGTIDLDLLRIVVPDLERADGRANVTLEVDRTDGSQAQARIEVGLDASMVRHASFPGTFEDLTAKIDATRDRYVIRTARAGLGGGVVDLSGTIDAEQWLPTRFDLDATATDAQVQWIEDLPPAIGDASLTFDGPSDALLLAGSVVIDEAVFSERIDWEDWVVEWQDQLLVDFDAAGETPWFSLDVGIRGDRTVRLANNVADGTVSADLRVIGDTSRPGLVGRVTVEEARVYLQDREFLVDRGQMEFRDPWSWDPELDFDLMTEITTHDQRYRVSYDVYGPFSDWKTTTRSDPPLAQADINALLWFGATAEELEEMGELSQAIAQGVADLVLADLFVSTQVGELREELPFFVERIEVVTGVNSRGEYSSEPRLLVETRFADLGDLRLTSELNFVRSDDQYVRLDQRLSEHWSLSGWYATRQRDRQLAIGGAYGVDLRVRWEPE